MSWPARGRAGRPGPSRSSGRTPAADCARAPRPARCPRRSATPGRKPSTSTSAVSARRSTTSAPPGLRRSKAIERRPRPSGPAGQRLASVGRPVGELVDADHIGAQVGEQHAEERHRPDRGQLDHPHAVQRPRHVTTSRTAARGPLTRRPRSSDGIRSLSDGPVTHTWPAITRGQQGVGAQNVSPFSAFLRSSGFGEKRSP